MTDELRAVIAAARERRAAPAYIHARIPGPLYEAIDAYADHLEVNLSEALRRLAVHALEAQGYAPTIDEGEGSRPDHAWKETTT